MKNKRFIVVLVLVVSIVALASGCVTRQANTVSYNIGIEADNFNVTRRLAVINTRTDKPMFELIGNFSLSNSVHNELEIICQTGENEYKKHFVYLNEWTTYIVEDVSGADVDSYHYVVNYLPESFGLFKIDTIK